MAVEDCFNLKTELFLNDEEEDTKVSPTIGEEANGEEFLLQEHGELIDISRYDRSKGSAGIDVKGKDIKKEIIVVDDENESSTILDETTTNVEMNRRRRTMDTQSAERLDKAPKKARKSKAKTPKASPVVFSDSETYSACKSSSKHPAAAKLIDMPNSITAIIRWNLPKNILTVRKITEMSVLKPAISFDNLQGRIPTMLQ